MLDYQLRTRLVAGDHAIEQLGTLAKSLGASRALVVSDPGVLAAGIFQIGLDSLQKAGIETCGFHQLTENPTTEHVEAGLQLAKSFQPNLLVGLGGGSSMDCAKGINFLLSCGGRIADYWGVGKATNTMLPLIAIPTTSGTGSEMQSFALISDAVTHVKMACGDPKAAPAIAILDPTLTRSQPPRVTALTGIDALTHALESFVTTKRNAMSDCYAREAWTLLAQGFPRVIENPDDMQARSQMQLGAAFAGMAIEASMLGAAHALANPLTAFLDVPHGQAVGIMMPHVLRFNATASNATISNATASGNSSAVSEKYRELARLLPETSHLATSSPAEILAETFQNWLELASLASPLRNLPNWKTKLAEFPSESELIEAMAEMASKQWTGSYNPRPASTRDFADLYDSANR
jgi:alcohol dehydrogenase